MESDSMRLEFQTHVLPVVTLQTDCVFSTSISPSTNWVHTIAYLTETLIGLYNMVIIFT